MDETQWVVFCPSHQHYLVFAGITGTTWTGDQAEARRYATKPEAKAAAVHATWLDHKPTPWPVPRSTVAEL